MSIDLEQATRDYWTVSSAYEGRNEEVNTGEALQLLAQHLEYLNPSRRIFHLMDDLQGSIIVGAKRKTAAPTTNPCREIKLPE